MEYLGCLFETDTKIDGILGGWGGGGGYHSSQGRRSVESPPSQWERGSSRGAGISSYGRVESTFEEEERGQRSPEWGRTLPARDQELNVRDGEDRRSAVRVQNRGVHR